MDCSVFAVGLRLWSIDSKHLPQMGPNAGDCELQREEHSGVADSVPGGDDLSGDEDEVTVFELYRIVSYAVERHG